MDETKPINIDFEALDRRLAMVEALLPKGKYAVTLVCRYIGAEPLDADMVLTLDDLNEVIGAIQRHKDKTPRFKAGEPWKARPTTDGGK